MVLIVIGYLLGFNNHCSQVISLLNSFNNIGKRVYYII